MQPFLTILADQHSQEGPYASCSTLLSVPLALMLESILLQRYFPYLPPGPCHCSLYIPPLPLSLSHQIKSLGFTFKFAAFLCLNPYLKAGIKSQLLYLISLRCQPLYPEQILWANKFVLLRHPWEKIPVHTAKRRLVSLPNSSFKTNLSSKTLFCYNTFKIPECSASAAETDHLHRMWV